MKFFVAVLIGIIFVSWQYHLPAEGDIRHWDGKPWEYHCNWVGCGWSPTVRLSK